MIPAQLKCLRRLGWAVIFASALSNGAWGAEQSVTWELRDAKGAGLEDAVVSLHPLDSVPTPAPAPAAGSVAEIFQQDRIFVPYVTVIRVGQSVLFPNRDSVQHHVYSLAKSKRFEIPLYGREEPKVITFDQPGVVPLGCNIHDWMLGYVVVLPTPHFAKSSLDGTATIAALPPGRYRSEIWHPRLAQVVIDELEIAADATPPVQRPTLKLRSDRRVRQAPAKRAGDYP